MVDKFWDLSVSQRRKVIKQFNLLIEVEWELPEPQRYLLAFNRAHEQHTVIELGNAISELWNDKLTVVSVLL